MKPPVSQTVNTLVFCGGDGGGEIMRCFDQGESFVDTRDGVPVGELTPLRLLRCMTAVSIAQVFRAALPIDAEQAPRQHSHRCRSTLTLLAPRGAFRRRDGCWSEPRGAQAVDLMLAAIACSAEGPLHTTNLSDFTALDGLADIVTI